MLLEIGLNSVDRDDTEVKEDIKKKGKKEELGHLENKVEITQQVSAKQPPLSCFALSTIIVLFRFAHAQRQRACLFCHLCYLFTV